MAFIDTHAHLYLEHFDADRPAVIERAVSMGVSKILLPNIDIATVEPMIDLCRKYPDVCFPMIGLHPTSVRGNYRDVLTEMESRLEKDRFAAVGETGIDLYWDKSFVKEQECSFRHQIGIALKNGLPVVIHSRDSLSMIIDIVRQYVPEGLKGVFHCFPGNVAQAEEVIEMGFMLGVGGVVTYKRSLLQEVVKKISLTHILLETDAPFLPPVPHRGKRNESAYLLNIAQKIAEIKGISPDEVADATTANAAALFCLNGNCT